MSDLHEDIDNYLALRRSLGYKLERDERFLHDFAAFVRRSGSDTITTDLAVSWATQPADADRSWWAARLGAVRVFARHQHGIDPRTVVPPADILPGRSRRADPYLYTGDEILALQSAARSLPSRLRAATYATLIGLLAVTGMRVGEALALDRSDIDWPNGVIAIGHAKFDKTRHLLLHPSVTEELRRYQQIRDQWLPAPSAPSFFLSTAGTRLIYKNVHHCFHALTQKSGLAARTPRCRPRIHDLRHTFAVTMLTRWYRDGSDIDRELPKLSAYLGHLNPASTYWYLTATPELLGLAAERLQAARDASR